MSALSVQDISIYSNSFQITKLPEKTYWQYDVITPEVKAARKRQQLLHHLQTVVVPEIFNPRALYDGKAILYASQQLALAGGQSARFCISLGKDQQVPPGTKGAVEIILSMTVGGMIEPSSLYGYVKGKVSLSPAAAAVAINVVQLIIKQSPNQDLIQNARAFFVPDGRKPIDNGLEIWKGFYQSVRPAVGRMIINVDTSATVVYRGGRLLDLCVEFLKSRNRGRADIRDLRMRAGDPQLRALQKHLQNLRIRVPKTIKGTKVIRELQPEVGRYRFTLDESGMETTVADYYQRTYGIRLEFPDIIGVQTSGRNAPHPVLIPLELCEVIPGQFYKKTLSPQMTSEMVKFTAISPRDRLDRITGSGNSRDVQQIQSPVRLYSESEFIRESGLEVDPRPISIKAKLLGAPAIITKGEHTINPKNGSWDMMRKNVLISKGLRYWAAVCFDTRGGDMASRFEKKFKELIQACKDLGVPVGSNAPTAFLMGNPNNVEDSMNQVLRDTRRALNTQDLPKAKELMVFVILPDSAEMIKNRVKFWGDCVEGIMTQCFKASKLERANNQFMNLVVLKLNARLGGTSAGVRNQAMEELRKNPFMLVGADVSHPGPQARKPSITSLVFSYDNLGSRYACRQRIQNPRLEIIQDLREMMIEALQTFFLANGVMPSNIIFFRDGVSEGEYAQVQQHEISAIDDAFKGIVDDPRCPPPVKAAWSSRDKCPKLVYIVVGKRHHNSFFPDPRDRSYNVDKTGNCPPGTLVDNSVTQPTIRDFFLQSHSGIKGTSRSGHYVILKDEVFGKDHVWYLQQICYSLCHVYANCTRSISIPTPVYYADMACTTAAAHFNPDDRALQYGFSDNMSTVSGSSEPPFDLKAWESAFNKVNGRLMNEMHFL